MFAIHRQLRLLFTTIVAVSALVLPAAANATVTVSSIAQSSGAPFYETQTAGYDVAITNAVDAPDSGTVTVTLEGDVFDAATFTPSGLALQNPPGCTPAVVTPASAGNPKRQSSTCAISATNGDVGNIHISAPTHIDPQPVDSSVRVSVTLATSEPDTASQSFVVLNGDPDCDGNEYDFLPHRSLYFVGKTLAEARPAGSLSLNATCTSPFENIASRTVVAGSQTGTLDVSQFVIAGHTVSGPIKYTPTAAQLASGRRIDETFEVNVVGASGLTTTMELEFVINAQADLVVAAAIPATVAVAPSGTNTTLTATLTNVGPDTAYGANFFWKLSDKPTFVSATANGATTTCKRFVGVENSVEPGMQLVSCPVAPLAANTKVDYTLTLSYKAGVNGLKLPATDKVIATTYGQSSSTGESDDPKPTNNTGTGDISLVEGCETGQTGTPPNCVTPSTTGTTFTGTAANDTFNGTAFADRFDGGAGNDTFRGGDGNDVGIGGLGNDKLFGGLGNDLLNGGAGVDSLFGESGNDKLLAGAGNDLADGGSGNDVITGDAGNDRLFGGIGNDRESGGVGNDAVYGQAGTDLLYCNSGKDLADGGAGNDGVNCADGTGGDKVYGGLGRDFCIGDPGDIFVGCETRIIK